MRSFVWKPRYFPWMPALAFLLLGAEVLWGLTLGLAKLADAPVQPLAHLVNVLWCVALLPFATVAHELGHALGAELAGMRVWRIELGGGRPFFCAYAIGLRVRVGAFMTGGRTMWTLLASDRRRLRTWVAVAAGPVMNAVLLFVALRSTSTPAWLLPTEHVDVAGTFAFTNLAVIVLSLLPFKRAHLATDGFQLATIPFAPPEQADEVADALAVFAAVEAALQGRLVDATAHLERELGERPDSKILRLAHAGMLTHAGEHDRARASLLRLRESDELEPMLLAHVDNLLAWGAVLSGREELADEALERARSARKQSRRMPEFAGTLGAVLVWRGDVKEGLKLLKRALLGNEDWHNTAHDAAWIAVGCAKQGKLDRARKYVRMARYFDDSCKSLRFAEAAIEDARAAPALAPTASY